MSRSEVVGDEATLTYDRQLDETSIPDPQDFDVVVDLTSTGAAGSQTNRIDVDEVDVVDRDVVLALARELSAGESATLTYAPGANPIRTASGQQAVAPVEETPLSAPPEPRALLFESAHSVRQGFVRAINHSDRDGEIRIVAIDETGAMRGPVFLAIGAGEVRHFNADDLAVGNPARGLAEGLGGGLGNVRLEFSGDIDVEVLSYTRTSGGFVTPLHDLLPEEAGGVHRLLFFNPGRNLDQVSRLRLVNAGAADARAIVAGIDDAGVNSGEVAVDVPAGATVDVSAADLETGVGVDGALGAGTGKWRLTVTADRDLVVQGLIDSPTGHVSNVSTAPRTPGAESGSLAVPLFPSAADAHGRQGFVRVINRSDRSGGVRIAARDNTDREYETLTLHIEPRTAAHFNSDDLELGNPGKGLAGSTGAGQGPWRLELSSDLEIDVLAYIRTAGGFLAPIHDLVPEQDGVHRVAFFNPGSNGNQVSRLRLANPGNADVAVEITGLDDDGSQPGTTVRLSVPALSAVELTAAALESGTDTRIRSGALGDGRGKWRLRVEADGELQVMSLLASPDGHLANVSTASESRGF